MARVCSICGKGRMSGNKISHSHRTSRRSWGANVQKVRTVGADGKQARVYVCTRCLRAQKKAQA